MSIHNPRTDPSLTRLQMGMTRLRLTTELHVAVNAVTE